MDQITHTPRRERRHAESRRDCGKVETEAIPGICISDISERFSLAGDTLVQEVLFPASWLQHILIKLYLLAALHLNVLRQLCELHHVLQCV